MFVVQQPRKKTCERWVRRRCCLARVVLGLRRIRSGLTQPRRCSHFGRTRPSDSHTFGSTLYLRRSRSARLAFQVRYDIVVDQGSARWRNRILTLRSLIADGYNMTDEGLIGQAYRSAIDGTLLRPSRPLSAVDSAILNRTYGAPCTGGTCNVSNVRGTHSAIPVLAANGSVESTLNTHYVLAWGTRPDATLQPTDLYPTPLAHVKFGVREHVFEPSSGQAGGCVTGQAASNGCIAVLEVGAPRVIASTTGGQVRLTVLHEPLPNGAYLLGELSKFVHVSPQRFASIRLGGLSPCGFSVEVIGQPNESVSVVAVDGTGVVRSTDVKIQANGTAVVAL